jgi:class 3 adenylate cyclase
MGDRRWRELLFRHHRMMRAELKRSGGRELDTAGDGFFAMFDTPASAIRCACAISDAISELAGWPAALLRDQLDPIRGDLGRVRALPRGSDLPLGPAAVGCRKKRRLA